jgi:hypothetical protein
MKKSIIKNQKISKQRRTKDQYTVVLENIQSDFKIFGEHLDIVEKKLDANIEYNHYQFDKIDKQFNKIDKEFEFIKTELGIIRNDLKEKVSREEFRLLEMKVASIESELRNKK